MLPEFCSDFDLPRFIAGVLSGEACTLPPLVVPGRCLMLGYMMLIKDGEGEGALEEKALEKLEVELAELTSQFWSSSRSSDLEGPPSELSINI